MKTHTVQQFQKGFRYPLAGLRLVLRPRLRRYVILPLLVNIVVFALLFVAGLHYFQQFTDWLLPSGNSGWLAWLREALWIVFGLAGLVLVFFTFSTLANLLGSPFNGVLAEAVECRFRGHSMAAQSWQQLALTVIPMLRNELRKLRYFVLISVPVLLLFLLPGVNLVAPFLWAILGCWILVLQYLDYPMANHQQDFRQVRGWLRQHRALGLGFGAGMLLGTLIPGLNLIMMPVGVVAATLMWLEAE